MTVQLEVEYDSRVSPSLHPQNVASLEDYDDDTKGELGQVVTAFHTVYQGVSKVHDARAAAENDQTLTKEARLVRTQEFADKVFKQAAGTFDKVHANMKSGIALLEKGMSTPVNGAATTAFGTEIRAHVKGLKAEGGSAMGFVRDAIESGDHSSVAAVLGAPAYLSGLTPETQRTLTLMYRRKHNPLEAKRLRAMQAAADLIQKNGVLLHKELENAVGAPPHKVHSLREAKNKADKAFSL